MDTLRLERNGPIVTVTLTRPAVHNAMNPELIAALTETFHGFDEDTAVRAVVLAGEGKSFCAGADVEYMRSVASYGEDENVADAQRLAELFAAIQECPKPVVARVHGAALGGGAGLVAVADIVVASEDAVFGFTEAVLGIMPAVISPFVLGKIGPGAARELFLTGERFSAARACEIGLVQRAVPAAELDAAVAERIDKLLVAAPGAQAAIKILLPQVAFHSPVEVRAITAHAIAARRASEEGQEGLKAFLEKRQPAWRSH